MTRLSVTATLLVATAISFPTSSVASTITGWITDNVIVGAEDTDPNDGVGGASVVYDQDVTGGTDGASSYGQITYIAPESNAPGVKVDFGDPDADDGLASGYIGTKKQEFDGCIMASSEAFCDSGFQSGKRIKQQVTGIGPIDLTFGLSDPDPDTEGDSSVYQVFHRLINVTGDALGGFTVELGTNVGDDFVASTEGDGLGFAEDFAFGPDNLAAFSQFPFGLFGGEDNLNPNPLSLPGFFDTTGRAGFDVTFAEDKIASDGYYGSYVERVGDWMSQEDVPDGLLYDYDPGEADPLVMAWAGEDGWEFLRGIDDDSTLNFLGVEPIASQIFAYDFDYDPVNGISEAMFDYISSDLSGLTFGTDLFVDAIEDLANLNLTFAISIDDMFASDSFTLRVTPFAAAVNVVPLPAGAMFLIAAMASLGVVSRRRRQQA